MKSLAAGCFVVAVVTALPRSAIAGDVESMPQLARDRGCLICHDVEGTPSNANSVIPLAPAFRDIARRYHGDPQAAARLSALVRQGTSSTRRHWEGKASGERMLPNAVEVTDEEARAIVEWILSLDPKSATRRASASSSGVAAGYVKE